jgi:hypothetical protein
MTNAIIASVILRSMKGSPNFVRGDLRVPGAMRLHLGSDEVVVGTYQNPEPGERYLIVFTDVAINVLEGEQLVRRILWTDVVDYESPKTDLKIEGLKLQTTNDTYVVPIAGSFGPESRFKDAFNLAMVFRSLLSR